MGRLYDAKRHPMRAHCRTRMAQVNWAPGIESVSGALSKINKKSPHAADQQMLLATHRTAPTTQIGKCNRLYLRGLSSVTRSTPPTARESAIRTRFAQVRAMVNQRMNNLATIAGDTAAFKARRPSTPTCG